VADTGSDSRYVRRLAITVGLLALAAFLWLARDALLLVFGGILLALLLGGAADKTSARSGLPRGWALSLIFGLLVSVIAIVIWLFGKEVSGQFGQLATALPEAFDRVINELEDTALGRMLVEQAENSKAASAGGAAVKAIAHFLRSFAEGLGNLLVIVFTGLYLAAQPALYVKGAIKLVPPARRMRAAQVLMASGDALRQWLIGQLVSMTVVGVLTGAGLWLLGVPSAVALAAIAALAEFIPIIGPIAAALPAILLAFASDATQVLYVALLYLVIQQVESYILYPLIQREAASLPPVLTLISIVALSTILGPLALIFATPLTVVLIVLVRMLYVEDVLGDISKSP
jgi:predicted PurR-regulated permease PerM